MRRTLAVLLSCSALAQPAGDCPNERAMAAEERRPILREARQKELEQCLAGAQAAREQSAQQAREDELQRHQAQERAAAAELVHQQDLEREARMRAHLHDPHWMQRLLSAEACVVDDQVHADKAELEQQRQNASRGDGQDAIRVAELQKELAQLDRQLDQVLARLKGYAMPKLKCREMEAVAACLRTSACSTEELSDFYTAARTP